MSLDALHARRPKNDEAGISTEDAENLYALIREKKPGVYIEVGTAAGVSIAYVIHAMNRFRKDGKLYAFDCLDYCHYDPGKPIAYAVDDMLDEVACTLIIKTNSFSLDIAETVREPIEFAFIDGSHGHPWTTIDTIAALPFLAPGATVAYHDINLPNLSPQAGSSTGPGILFQAIDAPKCVMGEQGKNLGIVTIHHSPAFYLERLLELFEIPWTTSVGLDHMMSLQKIIAKHYSKKFGDLFIDKVLIPQGEKNFESGRIDTALAMFEATLEASPMHALAHNNLGVCHWQSGNKTMALESIRRAVEIEPGNALFRENLALFS